MNITELRVQQKAFYSTIVSIFCPAFNDIVYFTAEGFNHLIFKSNRRPRNINEQWLKLKCLNDVPEVIKSCMVITDVRVHKITRKGKEKTVTQFELIHEVRSNQKIQVIVERIGNGKYKFRSVMPNRRHGKRRKKRHP